MEIEVQPARMTIDGKEYVAELATIESTHLGYEDHGIGTAIINFGGPAWRQSNEPRCLSEYDKERDRQQGTAFGFDFILRVLDVIGCQSWEQLKGTRVYVLREGGFGRIVGIVDTSHSRHLLFDRHHKEFYGDILGRQEQQ